MKRRSKGALTARAEYLLYRAVAGPLRAASVETIGRWGDRLGGALPRLLARRDAVVRRNLQLVFPEKSDAERDAIARSCWRFFARMVFRFLHDTRTGGDRRLVTLVPADAFERQLAKGKGLIVLTAHYDDWEGALAILNQVGVPVLVVVRMLDNELLNRDLYSARLRAHVELVDRRSAARPLLRTLERKGIVVLLADQAVKAREGILVHFLGRPAWTTPAPAKLAVRTGAPIVCAFAESGPTSIQVEVDDVIDPDELRSEERDPESLMERLNAVISARIRRHPEKWLWMHDRWKGTTPGAAR